VKGSKAFRVDESNANIRGVIQNELLNLLGHRVGDLSGSHNGDGNCGLREMSSGCFGFENGLGNKGNESVTAGFRRPLELYDISLRIRIYNEVCPTVRGILFTHTPTC
jgi:hypothetical protein